MGRFIDKTGWRMWEEHEVDGKIYCVPNSNLIVRKRLEDYISPGGQHITMWECECNCEEHNIIRVSDPHLISGHTKSCGCLKSTICSEVNKEYNLYDPKIYSDEYGEYRIGFCNNTGNPFYIDADDYDRLKDICFYDFYHPTTGYHYLQGRSLNTKRSMTLSYYIKDKWFDGDETHICDHVDRNPLNNRGYNLRAATRRQNSQNISLSKSNTSGFIGVSWAKDRQKWRAEIKVNGHHYLLGSFINKEDAIIARLKAEKKYFDEGFEPQRDLFLQYGIE